MKILSVITHLLGDDAASWIIWNIARLLQERGLRHSRWYRVEKLPKARSLMANARFVDVSWYYKEGLFENKKFLGSRQSLNPPCAQMMGCGKMTFSRTVIQQIVKLWGMGASAEETVKD
jgi:hypothetical protein